MRISITALLLAVWISALGGAPTKGAEPIEYAPTPGESASVALPVLSVEIYPKEIYLGDAIYLALYYENRSSQNVSISRIFGIDEYPNNKFRLSSPSLSGAYGWMQELRSTALLSSLAPSTMRDEVRLTRLQLEYYAAEQGAPTERAQAELVDWLKSLPEIQRSVMTTTLVWKTNDLYETPLCAKNRELIDALYDVLDRSAQERACFFRNVQDNKLEFPPLRAETVPSRPPIRKGPFIKTVKPTPKDLARGVKDLPDGFRVWDATGDGGIGQVVARYAQLKEPDDVLVLQSREGASFDVTFSALSEEDKAYARAMNDSL